ncbi:MAG TPA: S9 family peptidase, partial [Mycobacteriales bacterium]|nr:S9 family peptidase [Mycobacteriales bacterium]
MSEAAQDSTPFHDLSRYVALPRLSGLAVSPDGTRLVTSVATLSPDTKKYLTALWEIDPDGHRPARRLTRSAAGESQPAFLPDGSLLFTSTRPDAESTEDKTDVPGLWVLPSGGGEARQVAARPGGIGALRVARDSGEVVFGSSVLPGARTAEEDEAARKARTDAGVTAILHERYPVRFWDHDLGPAENHLFAGGPLPADTGRLGGEDGPRDLTPQPDGRVEIDDGLAVSPDGSTVALSWSVNEGNTLRRSTIVLIDTATAEQRTLVAAPGVEFFNPAFLGDGRSLVCLSARMSNYDEPPDWTLWLVDSSSGDGRDLLPDLDLWPNDAVPAPDGSAVYFTADELGHCPVFRLDLGAGGAPGTVTRLTASGAYTNVTASPDGSAVYALRSGIDSPPTPVRLDPHTADQEPATLQSPADVGALPGRVTHEHTTAPDGTALH